MSADLVLRCDHLVKFYDTPTARVQAVRGVDLELPSGSTAAVVGPSGSGKSSLLRMLAGLDRPTAGTVLLDGVDLWALGERARAGVRARVVSHIHQRPADNLFGHLTAEQQLARVVAKDQPIGRVAEVLELLGLHDRRDHLPKTMSGGEQQRLAFARAVVAGHRLVIADEPTSQLDADSATAVLDAVDTLATHGVSVLLASHDARVLERIEQVITLRDGAIATVEVQGSELAVIDRSGRLQLAPDLLERFPDRRVKVVWNDQDRIVELHRP